MDKRNALLSISIGWNESGEERFTVGKRFTPLHFALGHVSKILVEMSTPRVCLGPIGDNTTNHRKQRHWALPVLSEKEEYVDLEVVVLSDDVWNDRDGERRVLTFYRMAG